MCIPKALLFASALALFGCHEWLHGEPTIAPDPPPPTVGFGTDRDTGGNAIVIDGTFSKSCTEVAEGLQNSRRKYVVLDVRRDATWHSLVEAFNGARVVRMAAVRVRREGAASETSLRSAFSELEGGWLTLDVAPDAVKARTWPIDGTPGVNDDLPLEPSRLRAWLERHCAAGRCPRVVFFSEESALAARGLEVASAVFETWPFSVAPVSVLIGRKDGAPSLEFPGGLPPQMIQLVVRRISVRFKILPSGRVADVGEGSDTTSWESYPPITDGDMKACVSEGFKGFRFPTFEGEPMNIAYPIVFVTEPSEIKVACASPN